MRHPLESREIGGAVFSAIYRPDVEHTVSRRNALRRARYRRNIFAPARWLAAERFVLARLPENSYINHARIPYNLSVKRVRECAWESARARVKTLSRDTENDSSSNIHIMMQT